MQGLWPVFCPQRCDGSLPEPVGLSPRAQRRVVREAVTQSYPQAAEAINEDWGTHYDSKQVQRITQRTGEHVLEQQRRERRALRARRASSRTGERPPTAGDRDGRRACAGAIQARARGQPLA